MVNKLNTKVEILEIDEEASYGKFSMAPLERGYGTTLGNSLRRVLLSSLPGTAISSIKFDDGVPHEFSTIPGVMEDVTEIVLNLKGVAIKRLDNKGEVANLRLDVEGPKIVTAGDIQDNTDVEIVNRDHYICTVNSEGAIHMDLVVIDGSGYTLADQNKSESDPIGTIAIDSSFTPVSKVNYSVENTRVEQITDYDKLILEVWANGTVTPQEAVAAGSQVLMDHLNLFTELPNYVFEEEEVEVEEEVDEENLILEKPIEDLDLSLRSYNCLKRANINTVGDILEYEVSELKKIRNFGKKSFTEVESKINELGLQLTDKSDE